MAWIFGEDGNYVWSDDEDAAGGTGQVDGSAAGGKTLNLNSGTPYQRHTGIPAYNGYQAPNYGNTTPNSTHWLNTMNAYAPTARTDMERLLGQGGGGSSGGMGGSSGGMGGGGIGGVPSPITSYRPATGVTQPAYTPSILTPEQQANPLYKAPSAFPSTGLLGGPTTPAQPAAQPANPFPFQERAPGYMDAFYNVPGSAYAPPTQQQATQSAYAQPASGRSNGTIGINPSTGALTFL